MAALRIAVCLLVAGLIRPLDGEVAWPVAATESRGVSKAALDRVRDNLAERRTNTFLVIRGGEIIYEWYSPEWNASKPHYTASLAKALVGGTSLLLAWNDGRLSPDTFAADLIPAWKDDERKSRITLRHLVTHSSGIEDAEQDEIPHMELPGWKGIFWRKDPDPFGVSIHDAPVLFEPGTEYAYSNPGMAALSYAVTASLRGSGQKDLRTLLRERVMTPLGVPESDWSVGYGNTYEVDGLPLVGNWGGGSFTARAIARVGQWMLQLGEWDGKQLVSPVRVRQAVAYAGTPLPRRLPGNPEPGSGLGWYTNFDGVWPKVPRDAFAGAGAGNQVMLVVPSLDLVIVRNGNVLAKPSEGLGFWGGIEKHLFNPVIEAVADGAGDAPYPASKVIRSVEFEPVPNIRLRAPGSDNWPMTWAGDGHLYTSYGDGWGFLPLVEKKLSQGFSRIIGGPEEFHAENIRTDTGETVGDGVNGPKASGMLAAGDVLYAWVRNTGNSQLAWSEDLGKTWQWGFRFRTSFGSPAFLNFGRGYEGARDEFVYVYSQDGPSAYESDDGVALARAPADKIRERDAYEFFAGRNDAGAPAWTKDIEDRKPVLSYPGNCQRVDAVYNSGLKRYLLAVSYGHEGGWGIFDAPEPWGPWTTAFHTRYWGLGKTHGYRLPSKWISPDGRTMYLVFSGREHNGILWDSFCVRRMELSTR